MATVVCRLECRQLLGREVGSTLLLLAALEIYKHRVRVHIGECRPRQRTRHNVYPLTPAELLWCLLYVVKRSVVAAPRGCLPAVVHVVFQAGLGCIRLAKCCYIDYVIIMMLLLCSGIHQSRTR